MVPLDQLRNFCAVLIRDQTRREFRACLRWDHRFCALARISTPDAVQLERGARPELLNDRVDPSRRTVPERPPFCGNPSLSRAVN